MVKKVASKTKSAKEYDVCVIGGGPAGLMSAGVAACQGVSIRASAGAKVLLLEKNEELGKKLLISGGGRCNLTNADSNHRNFVSKYGKKGDFLYSPFSVFGVEKTIKFFNNLGLKTKIEPGFRVFPESDKSIDVLETLVRYAKNNGVEFKYSAEVEGFEFSSLSSQRRLGSRGKGMDPVLQRDDNQNRGRIRSVILKDGTKIFAKNFILASGGKSHPETGSTGDGFKWLTEIGHKVAESNPSLVPIRIKENWIGDFSGITLENVGVSVWQNQASRSDLKSEERSVLGDQKIFNRKGRVLFTHTGLSGPMILNISKDVGDLLQYGDTKIAIDFFPGVGLDEIHEKFKKLFEMHSNKKIKNLILNEVPQKIFLKILDLLKIDGEIEMHSIFREERLALIEKLKKFDLRVESLLGFDKAIITSGGLDLSEVNFKTMGSKLYNNLFFAGDILDFDRPSGGFSLQLCWTTGYIAGKSSGL
jgi:predicted Rossmann fold flavoprotein